MTSIDDVTIEITPQVLLKAYACGIFPMAESAEDNALYWIEPERRGILPLDRVHVPKRIDVRAIRVVEDRVRGEHERERLAVGRPRECRLRLTAGDAAASAEQIDHGAVMLLHRPELYEPGQHENVIEILVAKQRNGPTGEVQLTFLKQFMRFENFAAQSPFGYDS